MYCILITAILEYRESLLTLEFAENLLFFWETALI